MSKRSGKNKNWAHKVKRKIIESFGGSCVICGYNKCIASMTLHHLNPKEKDFNLSKVSANPNTWDKITKELRKCVLLCHNCHDEYHFGVTFIPENAKKFDETISSFDDLEKSIGFDKCPICEKLKPERKNHCSKFCAHKSRKIINWSSLDLLEEEKTKTHAKIADELGISDSYVSRKIQKLKNQLDL